MATTVTCSTEGCSENGIAKGMFGGGEIDESIPTYCGVCGALLLGEEPKPPESLALAVGDSDAVTWEQVPEEVTYQ
jgi:hypothetical protein